MHSSPFTVAGMSSSTSSHHSPNLSNLNSWGSSSTSGPLASSFSDSLSQSRSHYQSGYLMSASQSNNAPQGNQRVDEVPVVQTKAKMNQILSRGSTTEFGMDSMFQSSRQRPTLADEDAPPMSSINDIPNEVNLEPSSNGFQPRKVATETSMFSSSRRNAPTLPSGPSQPVYILVFGYPPDKYSVTAEYFKSLGASTEPDQNLDLVSCFRIGYYDAGDAMRAIRKNGEVLGGTFMVGAKWADPVQAEALLGQPILRSTFTSPTPTQQANDTSNANNAMAVDELFVSPHASSSTPTVGTPIKLAPSTSAFRKAGAPSKPSTPQHKGWGSGVFTTSASAPAMTGPGSQPLAAVPPPPSKSVVGQMSDLIFGW